MKTLVVDLPSGTPLPLKVYVVGPVGRWLVRRRGCTVLEERAIGWRKWLIVVRP